jgi:hypothetical protein
MPTHLRRAGVGGDKLMPPSPRISLLAAAALCASWSCGTDADNTPAGGRPAAASPPAASSVAAQLSALDSSFRALEDGDLDSPRDRWDSEYVATTVGPDPQRP